MLTIVKTPKCAVYRYLSVSSNLCQTYRREPPKSFQPIRPGPSGRFSPFGIEDEDSAFSKDEVKGRFEVSEVKSKYVELKVHPFVHTKPMKSGFKGVTTGL